MENNLLSQNMIESFKQQNFLSLQEQLEQYQHTIAYLLEQQHYAKLNDFLSHYSESLVMSVPNLAMLKYCFELQPKFQQLCPQNLAVLYLNIAHCFYVSLNFDEAKRHYYLASSLAMEYRDFHVLSLCANNLNIMQYGQAPDDIIFEKSKMPANLFVLSQSDKKEIIMVRFIAHIELAIKLNKLDYAFQFYERHFSSYTAEANSRVAIQLLGIKGDIFYAKKDFEGALALYNELLISCMEQKNRRDLIFTCFDRIILCYENLKKEQLIPNILDEKQRAIGELKGDYALIEKYVSGKNNSAVMQVHQFLHTKEMFENLGRKYSTYIAEEGITLLVVDLMIQQQEKALIDSLINLIHAEMQHYFATEILSSTQLNPTTLGYLVKLSESACQKRCAKINQTIQERFSGIRDALSSIYFSSVNNKEHQLNSFEKMRDLAFALIYYELYK